MRLRVGLVPRVAAISLALGAMCQAHAQSIYSPPRQDANSPAGVSYRNGTLTLSERDLSIGGDGSAGLSLSRTYNSGVIGVSYVAGPAINWSFSVAGYVSIEALPIGPIEPPQPGQEPYIYNVVVGGKSTGFVGGSIYTGQNGSRTGGPVGTYQPALPSGARLVFNGSNPYTGNYVFTDADGTVANFTPGPNGRVLTVTMPDGTRLDYTYTGVAALRSILSNRGWALLFESASKVCAVNMAQTYVTSTSTCPANAQTVNYVTSPGAFNTGSRLLISATRGGQTWSYGYNSKDHLNCIRDPGESACKIQTSYAECLNDPQSIGNQYELHLHDYVTSQTDASGRTYAYSYANTGSGYAVNCPKWQQDIDVDLRSLTMSTAQLIESGSGATLLSLDPSGLPAAITDPLGRTTSFSILYNSGPFGAYLTDGAIAGFARAEGDGEDYVRDARGNVTTKTMRAKPGSGLADITIMASYPVTCSNVKTCNKPEWIKDGLGNRTDYTYDVNHGGVLTEADPANAFGVRPVKRSYYAQRYAWIRNASGGYSRAASAVWVKTEERTCRATATVSGACAGGAADEVVTVYDYGPDAGPNNLLLRGQAVTADGQTLRTCYGYDAAGNKISETSPRAGLVVCP